MLSHVCILLHTLFDVLLCGMWMYSMSGWHTLSASHTRLLVAVAAADSHSLLVHTLVEVHTLSDVVDPALLSYSSVAHTRSARHTRSVLVVGRVNSYSLSARHVVRLLHSVF